MDDIDIPNSLSAFIETNRIRKKYSINKLAEKSGVDAGYISRLERGAKRNPSGEVLAKLADALAVDRQEIFQAAGLLSEFPKVNEGNTMVEDVAALPEVQFIMRAKEEMSPKAYAKFLKLVEQAKKAFDEEDD